MSNQDLTQQLAKIAHDMRGPLQLIVGHADLLRLKLSDSHELLEHIEKIVETGMYIAAISDDLLSLYKDGVFEETFIQNQNDIYTSHQIIQQVIQQEHFNALNSSLKFDFRLGEDVPIYRPYRFRRILQNLLHNAVQVCSDGGEIFVESQIVDDSLLVRVSDSGMGIETDTRDTTMKNSAKGLGLHIVNELITHYHGWAVWQAKCQANPSCVSVYLPLQYVELKKNTEEFAEKFNSDDYTF